MDFIKVDKESFRECIPYLQNEKINEYGFTPTCVYAPIDNAGFTQKDGYYILRFEDEGCEYINILGDFKSEKFEALVKELLDEFKILRMAYLSKEKKDILIDIFILKCYTIFKR